MRFIDWLIAGFLVLAGVFCLTVSGTSLSDSGLSSYIKTFLQICMWGSIPVFVLGVIYVALRKKGVRNK